MPHRPGGSIVGSMTQTAEECAQASPWSPREAEILAVTLRLLQEHGYDQLAVDAVADNTTANSGLAAEIVPFNPKQVVLEVFGAPGAVATINYLDVNAQPQQVKDAPLPWSFTITTTEPAVIGNVVAQGNGDTLGCRITVNGEVKDQRTVHKVDAYTFCLDKSG